jgi:hypothetical protein
MTLFSRSMNAAGLCLSAVLLVSSAAASVHTRAIDDSPDGRRLDQLDTELSGRMDDLQAQRHRLFSMKEAYATLCPDAAQTLERQRFLGGYWSRISDLAAALEFYDDFRARHDIGSMALAGQALRDAKRSGRGKGWLKDDATMKAATLLHGRMGFSQGIRVFIDEARQEALTEETAYKAVSEACRKGVLLRRVAGAGVALALAGLAAAAWWRLKTPKDV